MKKQIIGWFISGIVCMIIASFLANKMDGSFGWNKESWLSLLIGGFGIFATGVSGIILVKSVKGKPPLPSQLTFMVENAQRSGDSYFVTLKNTVNSCATNVTIRNGNGQYYRLVSSKNVPDVEYNNRFTVELKRLIIGGNVDIELVICFDNSFGKGQNDVVKLPENEVK